MTDWFDGGGSGSPVDVIALLDSTAPQWLSSIVANGALLSLGTTSDGGALGVTVTLDGRWRREYFRESEALVEWLQAANEAIESAPPARPTASSGSGQRSRRSRSR